MKNLSFILCFLFGIGLSCTDTKTEFISYAISAENNTIHFQSGGNIRSILLDTDIDISDLRASVAGNGAAWCEASIDSQEKSLNIRVKGNALPTSRMTVVTVFGKNLRQDFTVTQSENVIPKDTQIPVSRVTTTSFAEGNEPEKMIDGDFTTFFNSAFGAVTEWPFELNFFFDDAEVIDYLLYTPRPSGYNAWGSLGKVEIYAATKSNPTLKKMGEADFLETNDIAREFVFEQPLVNPTQVQVKVFSGFNDRVSCVEMQFFDKNEDAEFDYLTIFTDGSCSILKDGITQADVDNIPVMFYQEIAQNILDANTDPYRVARFRPYQSPEIWAAENKTSRYSLRDNATGIYIDDVSEDFPLLVGDTHGQDIRMNIYDFQTNKNVTYSLREGLNVITPSLTGLVYIYNHTDKDIPLIPSDAAAIRAIDELTVNIQFLGGKVNGYFDISKHGEEDWSSILENAAFTEIDILGTYSHVTWTTQDYRNNNTDIVLMTNYIDSVVRQHHEFMGLYKYNRLPKNRMFVHIDYGAPAAYATDYRTAYSSGYTNVMCTEDGFLRRMWVLGHELGHVNQVRPGMKWHGTTEVTNNLYAIYNQFRILGEAPRLFDNSDRDGYGFAFTNIMEAEAPFLLPGDLFNNHIPKLVPFWQLYLYFVEIRGQADFYHDIFEYYRTHDSPDDAGLQQLDFVRQVCNTGKMDMTDFFIKWGFLRPIDSDINDYGNRRVRITQEQIDTLIAEIKANNWPAPAFNVEEITDRNYKSYIN